MDFELSEEQRAIKNMTRDFMHKECPDTLVREWDEKHEVPAEIFNKLAATGVCGLTIPREYGGNGPNLMGALLVYEEIARQWPALSWIYCMAVFYGGSNIAALGDERQKKEFLPQLAKGNILFSYALTEPNAGSDLGSCQTMGIARDDEFILNGQKTYISGADRANYWLTLVKTGKDLPNREAFTLFIIEANSAGTEVRLLEKLGFRGCNSCDIFFNDVRVPRQNILGGPDKLGKGWEQLLHSLVVERLEVGADGVGIAQGALDKAISYARDRIQFGQPIINFQAISHKLAEMATEVEAARLLLYYAAWLREQGKPCDAEAAMAKLFACDVAKKNAEQAMLIAGGHGYMMESEMQRYFRDSLAIVIGGGTPEIQKETISRELRKKGWTTK